MNRRPTQFFFGGRLIGDGLDHLRIGDKHARGIIYQEDEVPHDRTVQLLRQVGVSGPLMTEIWGICNNDFNIMNR